jgi:hypothetical protein
MLTAILFTTFMSTAEAHQPHHTRNTRPNVHHQHHHRHVHVPRGHVWVEAHGWTPRSMVRWVPGHYAGRGHHKHWVPGKFVIRVRVR